MRSSRFYQNCVQIIGSVSEVVLFLGGFFLGQKLFVVAGILLAIRMTNKIIISELMYRRAQAVIKEGIKS